MRTLLTIFLLATCQQTFSQTNDEQLYQAVVKNDIEQARTLIEAGADPNFIKASGPWMKMSLLITAINNKNIEMTQLLLENDVDVNWRDGFKTSAIIYAANTGKTELLELLLANGANINDNDGQGNSVLTSAKESGNKEMIRLVKQKHKEE
ncbi:MAG: ankyrin repeat domain-containing protein [Reichenbachiella sp.]|uniref:ankyrin repeat domain-containing protein n=1 Tax=Reichenbachiella sp. TaxID=2184521 RepID=UPI0032648A6A